MLIEEGLRCDASLLTPVSLPRRQWQRWDNCHASFITMMLMTKQSAVPTISSCLPTLKTVLWKQNELGFPTPHSCNSDFTTQSHSSSWISGCKFRSGTHPLCNYSPGSLSVNTNSAHTCVTFFISFCCRWSLAAGPNFSLVSFFYHYESCSNYHTQSNGTFELKKTADDIVIDPSSTVSLLVTWFMLLRHITFQNFKTCCITSWQPLFPGSSLKVFLI